MLIKAKTLNGYKLNAKDGEIGAVKEFYFDDRYWTIRYLVAHTGSWLVDRQVLISPYSFGAVQKAEELLEIDLTKKQIENCPSLDSDKPVSRQYEERFYGYYDWPIYWGGPMMWGSYSYISRDRDEWKRVTHHEKMWDPNLRSTHDVIGHHIQAVDGEIGHVVDFIIDEATWAIRYLIVDTHNWLPGKMVLVSPGWIKSISWLDSKVFINHTKEAVKMSPEYTDQSLLTRDYESELHNHYQSQGYWVDEETVHDHSLK